MYSRTTRRPQHPHWNRASVTIVKELQAATGNVAEAVRLLQDDIEDGRQIARRCVDYFEDFGSCRLLLARFE
jgi:hypothetical protein